MEEGEQLRDYEDEMQAIAESAVISEILEWLIDNDPIDAGSAIVYRVRRGRRIRVGRIAMHVPTSNDEYEGYDTLRGGRIFRDRYAQPAETYLDALGRAINGTEALEKHGVLAGMDATRAVAHFLRDAAPYVAVSAIMRIGELYGVRRGDVAEILGSKVIVKRIGRSIKLEVNKNV